MAAKKEKIAAEKAERGRRMSTAAGPNTISKRASFFSTPEQVAKREELEAQLKALKVADDEAALQAKKDHIASEKARKAAGPGGQLSKANRGSFYSTPEQVKWDEGANIVVCVCVCVCLFVMDEADSRRGNM